MPQSTPGTPWSPSCQPKLARAAEIAAEEEEAVAEVEVGVEVGVEAAAQALGEVGEGEAFAPPVWIEGRARTRTKTADPNVTPLKTTTERERSLRRTQTAASTTWTTSAITL